MIYVSRLGIYKMLRICTACKGSHAIWFHLCRHEFMSLLLFQYLTKEIRNIHRYMQVKNLDSYCNKVSLKFGSNIPETPVTNI